MRAMIAARMAIRTRTTDAHWMINFRPFGVGIVVVQRAETA
jgi:hypothetical protein